MCSKSSNPVVGVVTQYELCCISPELICAGGKVQCGGARPSDGQGA